MSDSDQDGEYKPEEAAPQLKRPKKRSLIWHFFERTNQYRVRCYLCQHEQNYQGTTGNILRHMKSKHDVDLTLKGQQEPINQKRIRELSNAAAAVSGRDVKIERFSRPSNNKPYQKRKQSLDNGKDVKPYEENNCEEPGLHPLESFITPENTYYMDEESIDMTDGEKLMRSTQKTKSQLEDERIKAETKYFQEKAEYYKLLKHLTALQAKKVKIEIQMLTRTE